MNAETSYSLRAKEQLCLSLPEHRGCALAEIAAASQLNGDFVPLAAPGGVGEIESASPRDVVAGVRDSGDFVRLAGPSGAGEIESASSRDVVAGSASPIDSDIGAERGGMRPAFALEIYAETAALARRLYELIKLYTGSGAEIRMVSRARLYRQKIYCVTVGRGCEQLLREAGVLRWPRGADEPYIAKSVPAWIDGLCCMRSYMRAVFLFCGSAVEPKKAYHVEMALRDAGMAEGIVGLLARLDIKARIARRRENHVVYIKEADAVSDFLANIGAYDAMLEHEDTRIIKQVRNDVNRAVNCETANLQKTVNAAMHQRECIAYLEGRGLMEKLPEQLRAAAQARLKHPEASIGELADAMEPPISKSGMNHRLRRICQLAADDMKKGKASK